MTSFQEKLYKLPDYPFDPLVQYVDNKEIFYPIWFEMQQAVSLLLKSPSNQLTVNEFCHQFKSHLYDEHNLNISEEFIKKQILRELIKYKIIKNCDDRVVLKSDQLVSAIWADDVSYLVNRFQQSLCESNPSGMFKLFEQMIKITESKKLYPIETRYPILRAVVLLSNEHQNQLLKTIRKFDIKIPLVDSVLFLLDHDYMIDHDHPWVEQHTLGLKNVRIYEVTAEAHNIKGGLGRVEQYHTKKMKKLGANITFIEPMYHYKRNSLGQLIEADYLGTSSDYDAHISVPFQKLTYYHSFPIMIKKSYIQVDVYLGITADKMESFLIQDHDHYYVKTLYEYGPSAWSATIEEFTEFFTKAVWKFLKTVERSTPIDDPVIINLNDAQTLPLAVWRTLEKTQFPRNQHLTKFFVSATTHTYKNRCIYGTGADIIREMGVPEAYIHLWERESGNRRLIDATTAGLRCADFTKAVSAIHAHEVEVYDPKIKLYGITNGDDLTLSTTAFRKIMSDLGLHQDYFTYDLSIENLIKIKTRAKQELGLNPNQMTISYSGRLVTEKTGRERAFKECNLIWLVSAGVQVVIYGNVQPYPGSEILGCEFEEIERRIQDLKKTNASAYPGNFIFKPKFNLDEQIHLLAGTDLQVQDSDRNTGACEYTEADVAANGGLQFSPPFWEGLIAKQGLIINFKHLTGNTMIPQDSTPQSYLEAFKRLVELYQHPEQFAQLQLNSIRLSRVLAAELTATEYLRQWNDHLKDRVKIFTRSGILTSVTEDDTGFYLKITAESTDSITVHWGLLKPQSPKWLVEGHKPMRRLPKHNGDIQVWETEIEIPKIELPNYEAIEFVVEHRDNIINPYIDNNNANNYRINLTTQTEQLLPIDYHMSIVNQHLLLNLFNKSNQPIRLHYGLIKNDHVWYESKNVEMTEFTMKDHVGLWHYQIDIPLPTVYRSIGYTFRYGQQWSDHNNYLALPLTKT